MEKDYQTCGHYYYDYDRNCCDHPDSKSGRCGYGKCPIESPNTECVLCKQCTHTYPDGSDVIMRHGYHECKICGEQW